MRNKNRKLKSGGIMYVFFLFLGLILIAEQAIAQQAAMGQVTTGTGEPVPGATVVLKGTSTGTVTDADGNFSLQASNGDILVVSFVGMKTQEVEFTGQSRINVTLEQDIIGLEEVVAVGYGTVKKSDLTGSVMRIKGEDFKTIPTTQLTEMLAGTVAGFYSQQGTSAAGGSSLEIRGPSSLSAGTSPLIVLDGVIFNGSLRDINPNDVESIDILKDGSSAAIFGAKAASGVLLITTTKGAIGAPTINFSAKLGVSEASRHIKPLNVDEFLKFKGDYWRTLDNWETPRHYWTHPNELPDNITTNEWLNYSNNPNPDPVTEYIQRFQLDVIEIDHYLEGKSTNWYDEVMQKGIRQDYDLNIAGGTENIKYYWSLGYTDNEGIIIGDKFSAIRSRINLDFSVTDWLNAGINAMYSIRDESTTTASLGDTYTVSPLGSVRDEEGNWNVFPSGPGLTTSPLMNYFGTDRDREVNSLFANIYASIELPLGLNYRVSFQPRKGYTGDFRHYGDLHTLGFTTHIGGYAERMESTLFEWQIDNILKWNEVFGAHSFDVTLLYNAERFQSWSTDVNSSSFSPNQQLGYHGLQFGSNQQISNNDQTHTGDALMARLNYSLLGKYLLTASVRRDGYSAFGQQNPRATFPALALAWQISEEDFFNVNSINRLKFRVSWGINGNRDIGRYSALANLSDVQYYDGSQLLVGVFNNTLANTGLRWEKTEALNFGTDIGLFDNRIDLSLDYYENTTSDLLMRRNLPDITGFTSIMTNLGELENRGLELTLNTVNLSSSNFTWRSNFVFSLNRNKIVKLFGDVGTYTLLGEEREGELPDFSNRWFPGQAIDVVWNYEILGVYQEHEADEAAQYNLRMGDYKVVDLNEDGKLVELDDKQFIGHTAPRYRMGLRNDFSFLKNFTASIFIRADLGHISNWSTPVQPDMFYGTRSIGRPYKYWTKDDPNTEHSRLDFRFARGFYDGNIDVYRSRSFIRIQDFTLSYNLPGSLANRLLMNSTNIFFSVRNLYSFDKWPDFDPESGMSPMPRTFTLGINMSL